MSIEVESNFLRWLEKDKEHNQKTNPAPNYIEMLKPGTQASQPQ